MLRLKRKFFFRSGDGRIPAFWNGCEIAVLEPSAIQSLRVTSSSESEVGSD